MAPPSAKIITCEDQTIDLAGTPYASLQKMMPPGANRHLLFEVRNSSYEMMNAIRRTLISEMSINHLTAALADIKTTDPYLAILKRIEMIPVTQFIYPKVMFSVRFDNASDDCVDVLSNAILLNGKSKCEEVSLGIPISDINPTTESVVSDIYVAERYGHSNSRVSAGRIGYEILDQDFAEPSLMSTPSSFRVNMETLGVFDPVEVVRTAIDCLARRLESKDYSNAISEFGIYKLKIHNETYSVGRLLTL